MAKKQKICCVTYNEPQFFNTRREAIEFFEDCMMNSEGAERDRYVEVWIQLKEGKTLCYDEPSMNNILGRDYSCLQDEE